MARKPSAKAMAKAATKTKRGPKKDGITNADWEAAGGEAQEPDYKKPESEAAAEPKARRGKKAASPAVEAEIEKAKGRARKPKKVALFDDLNGKKIPEIEQAAESYELTRDARCKLSKDEAEKMATLVMLMKKHKLDYYKFEDHEVLLNKTEKAKVKRLSEKDSDDADDPDVMDV